MFRLLKKHCSKQYKKNRKTEKERDKNENERRENSNRSFRTTPQIFSTTEFGVVEILLMQQQITTPLLKEEV